jgi:hypothetical protein
MQFRTLVSFCQHKLTKILIAAVYAPDSPQLTEKSKKVPVIFELNDQW